jgi:hypothetical protein
MSFRLLLVIGQVPALVGHPAPASGDRGDLVAVMECQHSPVSKLRFLANQWVMEWRDA